MNNKDIPAYTGTKDKEFLKRLNAAKAEELADRRSRDLMDLTKAAITGLCSGRDLNMNGREIEAIASNARQIAEAALAELDKQPGGGA